MTAIAKTYSIATEHRVHIAAVLLMTSAFLLMLYAFNVYRVISHTVALEKIQKETATLSSNVDNLEAQFLDLSSKATPDNLAAFGFTQGRVSDYISRTTSLGTLATRDHEL